MDLNLVLIVGTAFGCVFLFVLVAGRYYSDRAQVQRRLQGGTVADEAGTKPDGGGFGGLVVQHFTEERFGVDSKLKQKLRRELHRAGYFGKDAIRYYVFARFCSVVLLPLAVFVVLETLLPETNTALVMVVVALAAGIGIFGPDAWLSRRQGRMQAEYRLIFPDLLDLLIICVSAGLSIEAAFERVRGQLAKRSPALGVNLELMGAESRAGRSMIEALNALADRLGFDEAASFVAVLRQSADLGGEVGEALRIYSDEMRDKRLLRAEETANKLPVKIVAPMAAGIFPVILLIVMLPVILKLMVVMKATAH
jgi:tight adherence protein C